MFSIVLLTELCIDSKVIHVKEKAVIFVNILVLISVKMSFCE